MSWSYTDIEYTEYVRNPLVSTDIEIRFFPILEIIEDSLKSASIQELLRGRFPRYKRVSNKLVSVSEDSAVAVSDEIQHVFSQENGDISLYLGSESLRVSSANHKNKKEAISGIILGYEALLKIFGSLSITRLGVRYVNVIDKVGIEKDLGLNIDSLDWTELIDKSFFKAPNSIVDLFESTFINQIMSSHRNGGNLALRYGLVQSNPQSSISFRFDIDRFIDNIDDNSPLDATIDIFALDIFSLFHTMAGNKLKEWMLKKE
jgi:uncharacterized protein (TIGR04255 family)